MTLALERWYNCGTSVRITETTYAKVLASKRRQFIERAAPSLNKSETLPAK
jgi:hypothetical protein